MAFRAVYGSGLVGNGYESRRSGQNRLGKHALPVFLGLERVKRNAAGYGSGTGFPYQKTALAYSSGVILL